MTQKTNNLAAYVWSLAGLLRGDFKQIQHGRIILPFTLRQRYFLGSRNAMRCWLMKRERSFGEVA